MMTILEQMAEQRRAAIERMQVEVESVADEMNSLIAEALREARAVVQITQGA